MCLLVVCPKVKMIEVVIKPQKLDAINLALMGMGILGMTALEVKFSEAMRTREERCRAFSCSMRVHSSGSVVVRDSLRAAPAAERACCC